MDTIDATLPSPRRAGLGSRLTLVGLAMALAAINTGNNLIYLLLALMLALALVGGVAGRRAARRTRVTAHLPAEAQAGTPVTVRFEVQGHLPLLPQAWFAVRLDGLPTAAGTTVRVPRDTGRGLGSTRCVLPRRGVFEGLKVRGVTGYPFDLSTHRTRAGDAGTLVVLPAFDRIRTLRVAGAAPRQRGTTAAIARGACGAGSDLHDIREYLPEDDARHIDWRASARTGRLMIRRFEREDPERRIDVVIDPIAADEESFERVISRCAAILDFAARHGCEARLVVPGRAEALRDRAAMRWLARAQPVAPGSPAAAVSPPRAGRERIVVSADPARCTPIEVRS